MSSIVWMIEFRLNGTCLGWYKEQGIGTHRSFTSDAWNATHYSKSEALNAAAELRNKLLLSAGEAVIATEHIFTSPSL